MLLIGLARLFLLAGSLGSLALSFVELFVIDFALALLGHMALQTILLCIAAFYLLKTRRSRPKEKSELGDQGQTDHRGPHVNGHVDASASGLRRRKPEADSQLCTNGDAVKPPLRTTSGADRTMWAVYLSSLAVFGFLVWRVFEPWIFDRQEGLAFVRLGFVGDTSAVISFRYPMNGTVAVQYRTASAPSSAPFSKGPSLNVSLDGDYTGHLELDHLKEDTEYFYRLVNTGSGEPISFPDFGSDLTFRTLPRRGTRGRHTIMFGSCIRRDFPFPDKGIKGFRMALDKAPNGTQLVFLGDTIYADAPMYYGSDLESYSFNWRRLFAVPETKKLLARYSSVYVSDDHEIRNDWAGQETHPFPNAHSAFFRYASGGNPASYGLRSPSSPSYYNFDIGDIAVFGMDTRRYRNPQQGTMLGSAQKQRLKEWLLHSNHSTFKVILSSVPVSVNWKYQRSDTWVCCLAERAEIFDFIKKNYIRNVLILSGDRHIVGITKFPTYFPEIVEYSVSPINQFRLFDAYTKMPEADDEPIYSTAHSTVNWGLLTLDSTDPRRPRIEFELVTGEAEPPFVHHMDMIPTAEESDRQGLPKIVDRAAESGDTVLNFA